MKVIFLDIDGVLNSEEYFKRWHLENLGQNGHDHYVDEEAVDRLMGLIQKSGCYIILSSSWRRHNLPDTISHLSEHKSLDKIIPYLIGITPRLWQYRCRGEEIKKLMNNWSKYVELGLISKDYKDTQIDNYAILDDDSDMLDEQKEHFVQTSWECGLQISDIDKCLNILGGNH